MYIENHGETLLVITPSLPIQRPEWNKKLVDDSQIPELLDRIASLRQKFITGYVVVFNWMKKEFSHCKLRKRLGSSIKKQVTHCGT